MPTYIDINKFRPNEDRVDPSGYKARIPKPPQTKGYRILRQRAIKGRGTPDNPSGIPTAVKSSEPASVEAKSEYLKTVWPIFDAGGVLPKRAEQYIQEFYDYIVGNDSRMTELVKLINKEKLHNIAEIGVFTGHLTREILSKCPTVTNYYGIDHVKFSKAWKTMTKKYSKKINFIHAKSIDAVQDFEDNQLDLVFIDGSHRYDDVKQDIEIWLPKVRPGGFLTGHDIDQDDVKRAVDETLEDYKFVAPRTFVFQKN